MRYMYVPEYLYNRNLNISYLFIQVLFFTAQLTKYWNLRYLKHRTILSGLGIYYIE